MKFKCKEDSWTRRQRWHPWFAWFPVRVGHEDCRWLETVQRIGTIHRRPALGMPPIFWTYGYRAA